MWRIRDKLIERERIGCGAHTLKIKSEREQAVAPRQEWLFLEGQYVAVPIQGDVLWRPDGGLIFRGRIAHCAQVEGGYELEEEYVVAPRREGLNEMESRLWRPDERG